MFEISLNANQSNQRLDKVLHKILKEAPTSFIYKMLRKKNITLNGEKALGNEKTVAGDTIQFFLSQETYDKMRGETASVPEAGSIGFPEIEILYEDSDVCIFVKPVGILSQKSVDTDFSVNEWVVYHATESGIVSDSQFETFRPSVCNRLDRNTAGIMAAGMSIRGLQVLSELFRDRTVHKYYYALVKGTVTEANEIIGYLLKDEEKNRSEIYQFQVPGSKPIHTKYAPIRTYHKGELTLLRVNLLTGRSHQIRSHLASVGHPILGDPKYGDPALNLKYKQYTQCLFAYHLVFPECDIPGVSGRVFEKEVPEDWPLGAAED